MSDATDGTLGALSNRYLPEGEKNNQLDADEFRQRPALLEHGVRVSRMVEREQVVEREHHGGVVDDRNVHEALVRAGVCGGSYESVRKRGTGGGGKWMSRTRTDVLRDLKSPAL